MMIKKRLSSLLACAALAALSGCGGGIGDVSGVVRFQGKPLTAGSISFYAPGKGVWSDSIKPDGAYKIIGVPAGSVKITVVTPLALSLTGGAPAAEVPPLPAKYADAELSGLTYQVRAGVQTRDFELD